jgi:predicted RNA-binding protein YlqC (UPF0109 family)
MRPANLLLRIVESLVDIPEAVAITSTIDGNGAVYSIPVDPSDAGKLIGKQGRTARALRTIFWDISTKTKQKISIDIART